MIKVEYYESGEEKVVISLFNDTGTFENTIHLGFDGVVKINDGELSWENFSKIINVIREEYYKNKMDYGVNNPMMMNKY